MEEGRVSGRGKYKGILVGAWVQCLYHFLGVDDINFESPDDNICEWNCVGDVIMIILGNTRIYTQAPVAELGDEPDGILIK